VDYRAAAAKAGAFSDANRVKILHMLSRNETCACNILEYLGITQPTLSYHMKLLTQAGFVQARRQGKWTYYSLNKEELLKLASSIEELINSPIEEVPDLDCGPCGCVREE